jgi:hypothetical protein
MLDLSGLKMIIPLSIIFGFIPAIGIGYILPHNLIVSWVIGGACIIWFLVALWIVITMLVDN